MKLRQSLENKLHSIKAIPKKIALAGAAAAAVAALAASPVAADDLVRDYNECVAEGRAQHVLAIEKDGRTRYLTSNRTIFTPLCSAYDGSSPSSFFEAASNDHAAMHYSRNLPQGDLVVGELYFLNAFDNGGVSLRDITVEGGAGKALTLRLRINDLVLGEQPDDDILILGVEGDTNYDNYFENEIFLRRSGNPDFPVLEEFADNGPVQIAAGEGYLVEAAFRNNWFADAGNIDNPLSNEGIRFAVPLEIKVWYDPLHLAKLEKIVPNK